MEQVRIGQLRIAVDGSDVDQVNDLLRDFSPAAKPLERAELNEIIRGGTVFVAKGDKGRIVGMVTLVVYRKFTGKVGLIEDFTVAPTARRSGCGKQLLLAAGLEAMRLRLKHLELTSHESREAARALYRSFGFVERDTTVFRLTF